MKYFPSSRFFSSLFVGLLLVASSCEDTTELGLELLPGIGELYYSEDFEIETSIIQLDSMPTTNPKYLMIGGVENEGVGVMRSATYVDVRPPLDSLAFPENATFIDAQVRLVFDYVYGDSTSVSNFKVFQLADSLKVDSTYYSTSEIEIESLLGETSASYEDVPFETTAIQGISTTKKVLKIVLDNDWGRAVFNESGKEGLYNHENFRNLLLKGLKLEAESIDSPDQTIYGLNTDFTTIGIRYSLEDEVTNELDTIFFNFWFYKTFNQVKTEKAANLSTLSPASTLNTALNNNQCIVQSGSGITTLIKFPSLKSEISEIGENVIINKAEIQVNRSSNVANDSKPIPNEIFYAIPDSEGQFYKFDSERLGYIAREPATSAFFPVINNLVPRSVEDPNFLKSGSLYFAGVSQFNASAQNYTSIEVTRYLQAIIENQDADSFYENGLIIVPDYRFSRPNTVLLNDANSVQRKLTLKVYYTKAQ